MLTKEDLIAFETQLAEDFNAAKIPHPIHLSDGNEDQLIDIFASIHARDWVCGSWRFHYQCLLKGVPPKELREACFRGDSIALCFPKYNVLCSAMVGGILPIAVGIAMGNKRDGASGRVHVWSGDMTAETGIFHECIKYASNHKLNMRFIVEDNELSVCTETVQAWGRIQPTSDDTELLCYRYKSKYPHAGAGRRVEF